MRGCARASSNRLCARGRCAPRRIILMIQRECECLRRNVPTAVGIRVLRHTMELMHPQLEVVLYRVSIRFVQGIVVVLVVVVLRAAVRVAVLILVKVVLVHVFRRRSRTRSRTRPQ